MNEYKFICKKCNYKTNKKFCYDSHCKTTLHITGERKQKPVKVKEEYKCDKCDYKSTNSNNYLTHRLNNHDTKENRAIQFKYYCVKCDFGVFTESLYKKHLETKSHNIKQTN